MNELHHTISQDEADTNDLKIFIKWINWVLKENLVNTKNFSQ
jgi:hypothetical protein